MMNLSRWKVGLVLIATLLGLLYSLPNLLSADQRDSIKSFLPSQVLNLGLDLQGGSYLLLEVDTAALIKEETSNLVEDVRTRFREEGIQFSGLNSQGTTVSVRVNNAADSDKAFKILNEITAPPVNAQQTTRDVVVQRKADQTFNLVYTDEGIRTTSAGAVDAALEVVRRRVDALGTKEPSIVRQGVNRIVVEVPGESDPEQLKRVIGQTAKLTFQMVDDSVSQQDAMAGRIPPGSELLPYEEGGGMIVVRKRVLVSGNNLKKTNVGADQYQRPAIEFSFDGDGARKFGEATAQNVGKQFAIILDGKVVSAPRINSPITGGSGIIEGNFTVQSASELVNILKGGALPAPLKIEQQRTVSAELGADSVQKGALSTVIALASVVIFMLLAYGFLFGGVAVAALFVNLVLLIGGMSAMQATLTLPGIAGLILTLAVAVDANVLIYERMRDEVLAGRSLITALDAGFSRAMETILDANVTSLVAAIIMYFLGAGPVKGFAVTLMLGIFTSVFSAVLVTQVLVAVWYKWRRPKTLPISNAVAPKAWPLIKILPIKTNLNFVAFARIAAIISVVAVVASLFLTIYPGKPPCGGLNCGVDFKGGTAFEMMTPGKVIDQGALRESLTDQGLRGVQVQGVGDGTAAMMAFETPGDAVAKVDSVKAKLATEFPGSQFTNTEIVGAKVSSELLTGGVLALAIAIGLMMVYIWFRFEWQFGLGAVFGLMHDVILTFGVFALFKLEFDLRAVAAILTIIGYSMNDTVVVFDRLRENLRKYKKMPLREIINLSINETLSRTIITGVTAVMALTGLAVLGGEALFSFSVAMIFGIIVGTYSSVYVAAPVILLWGVNRNAGDAEVVDMGGFKGSKKEKILP